MSIALRYIHQQQYFTGLKILDEIIEIYPKTEYVADAQFYKAEIYHNYIKDYEKAIEEYEKMIKKYPEDWRVKDGFTLTKIASCYIQLKNIRT